MELTINSLFEHSPVCGVAAAMLIPRSQEGVLDLPGLGRHIEFLLQRGIETFALNGATGEYQLMTAQDFFEVMRFVRSQIGHSCRMVAGVGAPSVDEARKLCTAAAESGSDGILLPMPYFFPYGQDDLKAFVRGLVSTLKVPTYLYNLPAFTTPLHPQTTVDLIAELQAVIGIKDSSGNLETLRLLRQYQNSGCILGNDSALYAGLAEGVCDGVVSGVACVLPELMIEFYRSAAADAQSEQSHRLKRALDEFITWLDRFPVPWGLKIIAEARGLGEAYFPLPLSPEKSVARADFLRWFDLHRNDLLATKD